MNKEKSSEQKNRVIYHNHCTQCRQSADLLDIPDWSKIAHYAKMSKRNPCEIPDWSKIARYVIMSKRNLCEIPDWSKITLC